MIKSYTQRKLFEMGRLDVVDLYEWHSSDKLNYSAYFQRQYVWREKDKEELIDTIYKGFPIPAVFLCEANTDLNTIKKTYNVLDGRQRLESIFSFINNEFKYNGKTFGELSQEEKAIITNYSVPIIQMYISPSEVDKIKEIFKRLNKNSYSLNKIEIKSSQLVEYDFMIICKILSGVIEFEGIEDYIDEVKSLYESDDIEDEGEISMQEVDVSNQISDSIKRICKHNNINNIKTLITTDNLIFSKYQISRQVNLQHIINILGTVITGEIIHRNLNEKRIIELSNLNESQWIECIEKLNKVNGILCDMYIDTNLDDFWRNRSCYYTLSALFYKKYNELLEKRQDIINILNRFSETKSDAFEEFKRYTQERGNDKSVRQKREEILDEVIFKLQ